MDRQLHCWQPGFPAQRPIVLKEFTVLMEESKDEVNSSSNHHDELQAQG